MHANHLCKIHAVTPPMRPMSFKRKVVITLGAVAVVAFVAVYLFFNPSTSSFFPKCVFLSATGYKCPGCGSQRFIHSMLHGDITQALHYNAYLMGALPIIAIYLLNDYTKLLPHWVDNVLKHPVTITALVVSMIVWSVLRNIYNW